MNLKTLLDSSRVFIDRNAPAILTGIGVTGVITTAVLTVRATVKALSEEWHQHPKKRVSIQGLVTCHWRYYIPPALSITATIAAIVFAQNINTRRNAAIMSAYTFTEKAFTDYKDKVKETIGANKEAKIHEQVLEDRISSARSDNQVYITGSGDHLCYDSFSGRYFQSNIENVRRAVNNINHRLNHEPYQSLNDFYQEIGLEPTNLGDRLGWVGGHQFDAIFASHITPEGKPCLSIDYSVAPKEKYYKLR